jgi:hypothetical protein
MHIRPTRFLREQRIPRFNSISALILLLFCAALLAITHYFPVLHADNQAASKRQARLLQGVDQPKNSYVPGEVLVRFRHGTLEQVKASIHAKANAQVVKHFESVSDLQKVRLPSGTSVESAVAEYRASPSVQYAEPNYLVHALQGQTIPNDPSFPTQWNLQNTGQNGGTPGADIHGPQAWSITTGSTSVVVAVIDSGVDYTHPDLSGQIWNAPTAYTVTRTQGDVFACPAGSHGFDAVNGTCSPLDDLGHGTHVSGIIGASTNDGIGVAGVAWNVQILPCKFLNSQGFGDVAAALTCLEMVKSLKDSGINIVASNNSWGGGGFSQALQDAIAANEQSGILFIAAAGNAFQDTDQVPTYPANYPLPNIIAVAASTAQDEFAAFSNAGRRTTHLSAPGDQILSTTPNNTYSTFSGTSMAAPHVTGVAALLKAQDSSRDWRAIKNLLLSGGDTVAAMQSTVTGKRLSAAGSLTCLNRTVQSRLGPIADTVAATVGSPITLQALSINCAVPAGPVTVSVSPGGQTVTLTDDGTNVDQAAGDGIFTGQWTPSAPGSYTLTFPWGDPVQVEVLKGYVFQAAPSSYTAITGTNLNLGDDSVVLLPAPFPVQYGGGSFTNLYVSSNGTISFTEAYDDYVNAPMPPQQFPPVTLPSATTLVAPWWQDLFPVKGTPQNVYWSVVGSAPNRQLVVEWRDVRSFLCNSDSTATIKFQVIFFEGRSDVQFNYADTVFGGNCSVQDHAGAATVGLQQSVSLAQMYSFGEQSIGDGTSVLWTIPSSTPAPNPIPVITSVSPTSAVRGASALTLTVNGNNFAPGSRIQYSGADRATTFVSSTVLTAQLSPSDLNPIFQSTETVQVFTPAPGGGTSQQLSFTILNPAPTITSLSPSTVSAGGLTFNLTVKGSGFIFGSSFIYWNGQPLTLSFVSDSNTMNAQIEYGKISVPGTAQVTVQTAGPGGGNSNALPLTIGPAVPGSGFGPAATTPAAQALAMKKPLYLGDSAHASSSAGTPYGRPMRFLGWNYGRKMGPAYMKYFTRPHGGTAQPGLTSSSGTNATPAGTANLGLSGSRQNFFPGSASLPGYGLRPTLPADYIPTSVATGDFNRDGKMDWVVSNGGTNFLWLYLGKGDGSSQLPVILPLTGLAPIQVVAADLRKIGILDLVVAEPDSGTVGVLLGNGDGTFQQEITLYAPGPVISLATGDFNGDGKVDIVGGMVGDETVGPVVFFAGDGKGGFAPPKTRPLENYVGSFATVTIQIADMNGDGLPDLIITDEGGVVPGGHIYLSEGDGTFKDSDYFFEDGPFVTALNASAGDMDGDGCADVVASTDAGIVYLFHGNCDGTVRGFPNVALYGAGDSGAGLGLADLNGDGHLDVVTSGITFDVSVYGPPTGNSVAVLLGDGQGHLTPGRIYRGEPGMFNLAIADLNGDGKPEILTANQDADTASVYLNDGKGGFGDPVGGYVGYSTDGATAGPINAIYSGPLVADVNGDGKPDILFLTYPLFSTPNVYSWKLNTMLNDGTGHFGAPVRSDAMEGTLLIYDLQLLDVRGTGKPDLVVLGGNNDVGINTYIGFAPNLGNGTFGPLKLTPFSGSPWIFAAGDFDGDGKIDLIIMGGSGQTAGLIDRLTFWKGNGDGTFTPGPNTDFGPAGSTGGAPRMSFVSDFNGDHKLDLIVTVNDNVIGPGSINHSAYEFFGNGDGTFQPPVVIIPDVYSLTMVDLNHDGHQDLVEWLLPFTIAGFGIPRYKVHLGQPDGSFQDGETYAPFGGLVSALTASGISSLRFNGPLVADVNGDGNPDILAPQRYPGWAGTSGGPVFSQGYFQVLLGNGDGTFTPDFTVFNLAKIFPPDFAVDVNGDGRADLVEVDPFPSSYNVILASSATTIQATLVSDPLLGNKGTLRLNLGVAPSSATNVTLSTSDPNISIASSVSVPGGSVTQDVPFTIGAGFNPLHVFSLTAQLGTGSATAYGTVAQPGSSAGFQLYLNNSMESTGPGGTTADYGLGIVSVNGYSTSVQIQCQGLPAGASCQAGQDPATLLPGTFLTDSLTVTAAQGTPRGSYPFTIVVTDGIATKQLAATLGIADFSLSVTPSTQVTFPGQATSYSLMLTPLNGWSQTVQISCPVTPPGPKCSMDGTSTLPGTYAMSIDPQSAPTGNYSISITANGAGVSHATTVALNIEDATIALSKTADTVSVGNSTSVNVSLTSVNGFSDQFSFTCPDAPAGIVCTFKPATGTLPANSTLTSALTIQVNSRPAILTGMESRPRDWVQNLPRRFLLAMSLIVALAMISKLGKVSPCGSRKFAVYRPAWAFTVLLAIALSFTSCGGGGSSSTPPPPPPPPPTATVVKLQVQAVSPSVTRTSGTITITIP